MARRRTADAQRMTGAFYTRDGDRYVPTGLGVSPWNPRAQMGVALAGLAATALDPVPSPAPMVTARLTIDIMGAVPLEPLAADILVLREGKRMQLLSVELTHGGRIWVRATALRVRVGESPCAETPPTRSFPDDGDIAEAVRASPIAATVRVQGGYPDPGPGAWWVNPTAAVVVGESLGPLAAVAMVSDYGSGVAPLVSPDAWTFANVDIGIHLTRLPRGDWLLVDATSESAGNGIGVAHARLGDRDGMFGSAHQTVFLDRR